MNQYYVPRLTPVNKIIIIIAVAFFLIQSIWPLVFHSVAPLGLTAPGIFSGQVYQQLLTYPFLAGGLLELVFSALIIWFVGSELETSWGRKRYITFFCLSAISGAIFFLLVCIFFSNSTVWGLSLFGLAGFTNAILLAYAILYPDQVFAFMLLFPMRARWFCLILLAMQLYLGFFSPSGVLAWGQIGAMMMAPVFLWFNGSAGINWRNLLKRRKKSHLSIVPDKDSEKPRYWH